MAAPRLTSWTRFGGYLGEVWPLVSFVHKAKLNGEDSITFETLDAPPLAKGTYLLWADDEGVWHEHIVTNIEQGHSASRKSWKTYAVASICELAQDYIVDKRPGAQTPTTATAALTSILDGTRWVAGNVDVSGRNGASVYHKSAYEGLSALVGAWGGQMIPEITVSPLQGVTARAVAWRDHLGHVTPQRRLEFGRDLGGITRTVDDASPITACYAWGKGEQLDSGGYGRRIGIDSVTPDGLPYVHDDSLLATWGIPGPNGTLVHRFGELVDGNCEDPQKLKAEADAYLAAHCTPTVSYKGDVAAYADVGADVEGLHLGDELQVVDAGIDIRVQARVIELIRDYVDPSKTKVTLGNFLGTLADQFGALKADVSSLLSKSSGWDVVEDAGQTYIEQVMSTMNDMFDQSGGYVTFDPATGITVMDAAMFDDATSAMQINGLGFRIANSKSGDAWVWRTFGTGAGFVADEIITGVLTAILIQSATDPTHNYLNLQTGVGQWLQLIVGKVGVSADTYAEIGTTNVIYPNAADGAITRMSGQGIQFYKSNKLVFNVLYADQGVYVQDFDANGNVRGLLCLRASGSAITTVNGSKIMTFDIWQTGMTFTYWDGSASHSTTIPPGYTLGYVHRLVNPNGEHFWTIDAAEVASLVRVGWTEESNAGFYAFAKN